MFRITDVKAGQGYILEVTFADGTSGKIDLSSRRFGPVFEPLRDPALFSQVRVDEYGAVCWPNGADLAPGASTKTISSSVGRRRMQVRIDHRPARDGGVFLENTAGIRILTHE